MSRSSCAEGPRAQFSPPPKACGLSNARGEERSDGRVRAKPREFHSSKQGQILNTKEEKEREESQRGDRRREEKRGEEKRGEKRGEEGKKGEKRGEERKRGEENTHTIMIGFPRDLTLFNEPSTPDAGPPGMGYGSTMMRSKTSRYAFADCVQKTIETGFVLSTALIASYFALSVAGGIPCPPGSSARYHAIMAG